MFTPKRFTFFVSISVVGGLVIGLVAGTNISPFLAGIIGALVIFSILTGTWFLAAKENNSS
jgi:hypothetical protein